MSFTEQDWLGPDPTAPAAKPVREHRVYGPPGTGKTTYLSRQVNVAARDRYLPESILVASLTKAAAQEVAGRDTLLPSRNIGTLHAHAFRALDRPKIAESAEGIKAWNEWVGKHGHSTAWKMDPRASKDPNYTPPEVAVVSGSEGELLLSEMQILRARMTPRSAWSLLDEKGKLERFADAWQEFKTSTGMLDFTDLIERCLDEHPVAPGEPALMFLDEAQDMSAVEFALARQWGAHCEQLVVVGDPDQNLYEWRGSDPSAMTSSPAETERVLEQSYRVPREVHAYAVKWIEQIPDRVPITYHPRDEDGEVRVRGHQWPHPEGLLSDVLADIDAGLSVMVLASCGFMLDPFVAAAKQRGVPFHNPYRATHGGWNPLKGAARIAAFLRPDAGTWGEQARPWNWREVDAWMEPIAAKGTVARGGKTLVKSKLQTSERFPDQDPGEREAALPTVLDLFPSDEDKSGVFEQDVAWWAGKLRADRLRQLKYGLSVYRQHGGAALVAEPALTVGTIHSVKGGQADSVYVLPDLSARGWALGWQNPNTRPPTIRQFYVAFTRARLKLTLCASASINAVRLPR